MSNKAREEKRERTLVKNTNRISYRYEVTKEVIRLYFLEFPKDLIGKGRIYQSDEVEIISERVPNITIYKEKTILWCPGTKVKFDNLPCEVKNTLVNRRKLRKLDSHVERFNKSQREEREEENA